MGKIVDAVRALLAIGKDGKVSKEELPALLGAIADLFEGAADFIADPKVKAILKGVADALRLAGTLL